MHHLLMLPSLNLWKTEKKSECCASMGGTKSTHTHGSVANQRVAGTSTPLGNLPTLYFLMMQPGARPCDKQPLCEVLGMVLPRSFATFAFIFDTHTEQGPMSNGPMRFASGRDFLCFRMYFLLVERGAMDDCARTKAGCNRTDVKLTARNERPKYGPRIVERWGAACLPLKTRAARRRGALREDRRGNPLNGDRVS